MTASTRFISAAWTCSFCILATLTPAPIRWFIFRISRAVAVGDLFASAPDPNYAAGGSLVGWGPVLAQILKLDFDIAVPSQGPTVTRAELEAFKTKIDTLVSRAGALVSKGVPENQLMSQLQTDDLGWKLNFTPAEVEGFYAELSKSGQPLHAFELNVPAAPQK